MRTDSWEQVVLIAYPCFVCCQFYMKSLQKEAVIFVNLPIIFVMWGS
jgi:hypothetical protein